MSKALILSSSPGATFADDVREALRRVPPAVLHGVMAAAVLCALGSGAIGVVQHARAEPARDAAPASAPDLSAVDLRTRCAGCGIVESIRHLEAAGLVPAAYEFTVRMRDGSVRTSSDPSAGTWLVGERIILVGGASAKTR